MPIFSLVYLDSFKSLKTSKSVFIAKLLDNKGNVISVFINKDCYDKLTSFINEDVTDFVSFQYFEHIVDGTRFVGYIPKILIP